MYYSEMTTYRTFLLKKAIAPVSSISTFLYRSNAFEFIFC